MPFVNISTSVKVDNKIKLLKEISILIASLTNKPKRFVMAKLEDESKLFFEDQSPCCFIEIKSIGSLKPSEISKTLCSFVHKNMGIQIDKIYICFDDVAAEMWGWNGKTFG
tara:strand:- start:138 stop:470 length:333 start_codon:yes stop_codon:yes gene_type:complete